MIHWFAAVNLKKKKKPEKKSATQRRWLLTQVFYASYLDWTIMDHFGGTWRRLVALRSELYEADSLGKY